MNNVFFLMILLVLIHPCYAQMLGNSSYIKYIYPAKEGEKKIKLQSESKSFTKKDKSLEATDEPSGPSYFSQFGTLLGACFDKLKPSFEVQTKSIDYRIFLPKYDKNQVPKSFSYINLQLFNRASVTLDSLAKMASDYVTTLQPSPLTARLAYEFIKTGSK